MLKELEASSDPSLALEVLNVLFEFKVAFIFRNFPGTRGLSIDLSLGFIEVVVHKKKKPALVLKDEARNDGGVILPHVLCIDSVRLELVLTHLEGIVLGPLLSIINI